MRIKKLIKLLLLSSLIVLNGCGNVSSNKQETSKEVNSTILPSPIKSNQSATPISKSLKKEDKKIEDKKIDSKKIDSKKIVLGDPAKGQKIYSKKLKKVCGMKGGEFSRKHTQDEWRKIQDSGKMSDEIIAICKKDINLKDKYILDISAFVIEFANDSGNIPSGC